MTETSDPLAVPYRERERSVTKIYPTANWHEREAYDMFGVAFKGHPDLRRTYMWQDHFDHHPLLKSFEISTKRTFENLR